MRKKIENPIQEHAPACADIKTEQERMRNQSAKNPKVFPASVATLDGTLRNDARVCEQKKRVTKLMHYGFVCDTSRLAQNPSARYAYTRAFFHHCTQMSMYVTGCPRQLGTLKYSMS